MGILILTLIIIIIGIGIFIGFKLGTHFVREENNLLHNQIHLLQQFSTQWAAHATSNNSLSQQISQQHTNNISATMTMVIQMLNTLQREKQHELTTQENKTITDIINQSQRIIPPMSESFD